ncbi:LOW QUALITY PROTEIN: transmembrane protein 94-like [Amphiura filiformis]|uniref:LOW QUALITY PROTEIN: transmembrane protein 94-like n=1 Tax=Amphiura filiformis TaxID=82378 RepID=UPI003B20E087
MIEVSEPVGLCSSAALQKLCVAIEDELNTQEAQWQRQQTLLSTIGQTPDLALRTDNAFHWTSALWVLIAAVALLIAAATSGETGLAIKGGVLLVVLVVNLYVTGWDSKLRNQEVLTHAQALLTKLQDLIASEKIWEPSDYLPLYAPPSGGINLQWTYRDSRLVNLPTCLLVKDDVILLKPGQPAPTKVAEYEVGSSLELAVGESYQPTVPPACTDPKARKPLKPGKFIVKETPYIPILRACLQKANERPVSSMENKRILSIQVIERYIMPAVLVFSLVINLIRFVILDNDHGHWADMIIAVQISTIFPLLSLAAPIMWIAINAYGIACIVTLFHKSKDFKEALASDYSEEDEASYQNFMKDKWSWREVWHHFMEAFLGKSKHLPRTASLLHCLGSVTSLCCIDKRGILSYPDPSVEKVFFMSGLRDEDPFASSDSDSVFEDEVGKEQRKKGVSIQKSTDGVSREDHFPEIHTEVLTLSIDSTVAPPGLQFDDRNWERHINSLKPMGLNILLNTCHEGTVDRYSHFLDHVYSSVNHEEIKHVLKLSYRRCLCQLAHLIGFTEQATQGYDLKHQLAMYRLVDNQGTDDHHHHHLQHKARSFIKRKIPAPHLLSVCIHDPRTGNNQLLTQGTADLVLSLSTDFWDGNDLCPLTDNEKKKVMDFYQRATLSSYCSAFSYQPMVESMANYFDDLYLELPKHNRDSQTIEPESPGVARSSWDVGFNPLHPATNTTNAVPQGDKGRKYHSLESAMDKLDGHIRDSESCYRAQCGQIFIGMVASNYHPKQDIVALIENLDNACIRFVHFSRDQELRSRVFTEKMGLEAGWNCHISLLSEEGGSSCTSTSPNTLSAVSRQHSDTSAKSGSHLPECRVNMDVCNVRVSWQDMAKEDKMAASVADPNRKKSVTIELGNATHDAIGGCQGDTKEGGESTKDVHVDLENANEDNDASEIKDENSNDGNNDTYLPEERRKKVARTSSKETDAIDAKNMNIDTTTLSSESESLLQPGRKSSYGSDDLGTSLRQRYVSETQTLSDGTDGDTISHYTESDTTGGFDITNRAKLPRGIENIRPHLEKVDNVPLLVPLFTDVTHATTREMIQIMQENSEVVCCMGSSVSIKNVSIFSQADISIGVEPLYPHVCLNRDIYEEDPTSITDPTDLPMGLASLLSCLPCSLSFRRGDHISIIELIKEARGFCMAISNCFSFMMYSLFSLCAIQLMASLLFMPPPLSGRHVLWLVLVVIPTLSLSLLGSPFQSQIMTYATGKKLQQIDREVIVLHGFYFISKFMGSVIVSLICFGLTLYSFCCQVVGSESCHVLLGFRNSTGLWNGLKGEHYSFLVLAQNTQTFLLTFYLIVTSASFVHRLKSMWRRPPFTNHLWCAVVVALLLLEIIYFVLDVRIWNSMPAGYPLVGLRDIPLEAWILAFVWPLVCLTVCEIIKIFEIRVFVRWQKRTKLQFGTKLGMNSPF